MKQEQERGNLRAFTHLEVHSFYTLLGATPSIEDLVSRAKIDCLSHLALTDRNALYGAVAFDQACQAAGIQSLIGMTIEVATPPYEAGLQLAPETGQLVLLAMNPAGYRSLCRLSSFIQTRSGRTRGADIGVSWEKLKAHREGLICLTGGIRGWLYRLINEERLPAVQRLVSLLGTTYGDNAFLRLEINRSHDEEIATEVTTLAKKYGLPLVAAQSVYYMKPQDAPKLRLLQAIARNCPVASVSEDYSGRSWLSPKQMADRFKKFPEALGQISEIVSRCEAVLPDGRPLFPVIAFKGANETQRSSEEHLGDLVLEGLREKYGPQPEPLVEKRLQHELAAIARSGHAPLFLIVADIVHYARENDIPVSTRGSVANSLAAFCAGITTVDPITHDLLFERFLNPARINPPDIDLDFCSRRRDEVLAYVRSKYGEDKVALVATVSTMQPKSAVRETAKALGLEEERTSQLVKRLPRRWHPDPRRRSQRTMADLVAELEDEKSRVVLSKSLEIVGQPHHMSIHPGGVVITPGPLTDIVPVQWTPKGFLITQYGHADLEAIGLPKIDLLGIRALTVLADAADLVRHYRDPDFRLADIPLNDPVTGDLLENGHSIGVFQCESAGAQRTMRKLKARTVQDLAVANAFFKPGPATGGMAQAFVRRYRGEERVEYLHPTLEPILGTTQGVLLFQEQILRVATEIAGLSWQQADHLRRGMSKFKPEEMDALEADFVSGCQRPAPDGPGFSKGQAKTLWEQVQAFAGYGFNRGHATAYADISYRSAYLKAHWPEAFFCARLADRGGFHHPAIYMAEARRLGIKIRPPHVNFSQYAFTLSYDSEPAGPENGVDIDARFSDALAPDRAEPTLASLWMGLGQVRDLRKASVQTIIDQREIQPFKNLADLSERVSLQTKELDHLIQCGALDGLGKSRAAMLAKAQSVRQAGSARQISFDFGVVQAPSETAAERLDWEQHLLGLPATVHPLDIIEEMPSDTTPITVLTETDSDKLAGQRLSVVGVRLPGWTGGPGFFLANRDDFITVNDEAIDKDGFKPEPWQPVEVRGRWRQDPWGTSWLQADRILQLK